MIPLAGKLARFQSSESGTTVNHEFSDWSLPLKVDLIPTDGFEKDIQDDGNYYKSVIAGLAGGTVKVKGVWNYGKNPLDSFSPGLEIGVDSSTGSPTSDFLYLFLDATIPIGIQVGGICEGITQSTDVTKAGMFEMDFFVETVVTFPSS